MPKYISRSTGKIIYPDQIRSGEVTDAVEVDRYPEQAAVPKPPRHVIDVPKWAQKGPLPEVNPFGKWCDECAGEFCASKARSHEVT